MVSASWHHERWRVTSLPPPDSIRGRWVRNLRVLTPPAGHVPSQLGRAPQAGNLIVQKPGGNESANRRRPTRPKIEMTYEVRKSA